MKKNKTNFGDVLKNLIKNTNISSKDLAEFISYDASSVSKWVNNKHKPSLEELDYVVSKVATCFSKTLYKDKAFMKDIFNSQKRKLILTKNNLEELLKSVLYVTYGNTPVQIGSFNVFTESGYHNIVERTDYIITRNLYLNSNNADNHIDFYISYNPFTFYDNERFFLSPGLIMATEKIINTHLLISDEFIYHIMNSTNEFTRTSISSILSKLYLSILFNTNIYHSKKEYYDSFVYIKDNVIIYYKSDSLGKPFLMGSYDDELVLKEVDNICPALFKDENIIYKSTNNKTTYINFFVYSLINKSPIVITISHIMFYFFDDEWLDKVINSNNIDNNVFSDVRYINDMLFDILESGTKVTLIIDFESFFEHINKKDIWLDDIKVKVSKKLILEYMENLTSLLEKYPNFTIYQKSNLNLIRGVDMFSMNTLFSKGIIMTKKNPSSIISGENAYGYLNPSMSKKIAEYGFELLDKVSDTQKIDKTSLLYLTRLYLKL